MNVEDMEHQTATFEDVNLELQMIQGRLGRKLKRPFLNWDATPDLAQATWEWPFPPQGSGMMDSVWEAEESLRALGIKV